MVLGQVDCIKGQIAKQIKCSKWHTYKVNEAIEVHDKLKSGRYTKVDLLTNINCYMK